MISIDPENSLFLDERCLPPTYLAGSMLVVGMIMEKQLVSHSHEPQPNDYNPINGTSNFQWNFQWIMGPIMIGLSTYNL